MVNVKITKTIRDTEMTVVRNELERGENSPQSILRERVEATAYLWHNYGKSTIGSKEDLEKVPVERLEAFYKSSTSRTTLVWWSRAGLTNPRPWRWLPRRSGGCRGPAVSLTR